MSNPIGWCDETWNPITGCTKIKSGCANCYAERMAKRLAGRYGYPNGSGFAVTYHPEHLYDPMHWETPRRVFVESMGDFFHKDVRLEWQAKVLDVVSRCPQHTFLFLTKRPRLMQLFEDVCGGLNEPNIYIGVSVSNQDDANEFIPQLLQTPDKQRGAVLCKRFVSVEPILDWVDLNRIQFDKRTTMSVLDGSGYTTRGGLMGQSIPNCYCDKLDLVIVGAETGPGARPLELDWIRRIRDDCQFSNVPFRLKQVDAHHNRELDGQVYHE
jgi:protein gp37